MESTAIDAPREGRLSRAIGLAVAAVALLAVLAAGVTTSCRTTADRDDVAIDGVRVEAREIHDALAAGGDPQDALRRTIEARAKIEAVPAWRLSEGANARRKAVASALSALEVAASHDEAMKCADPDNVAMKSAAAALSSAVTGTAQRY